MLKPPVSRSTSLPILLVLTVAAGAAGFTVDANQWSEDVRVTYDQTDSELPTLVELAGGHLGLVWTDIIQSEVNAEVLFTSARDLDEWSSEVVVMPPGSDKTSASAAMETGGRLHVVCAANTHGNYEICHVYSDSNGIGWSDVTRLTNALNQSWDTTVQTQGQNVYCIWDDNRSGRSEWSYTPAVYFRSSCDNGLTWNDEVKVSSNTSSYAWAPQLLVDEVGTLHVVWNDRRNGALEIYYDYSTDQGATWHEEIALTIDDDRDSDRIAWTLGPEGNIHLFWLDRVAPDTHNNPGIYYRQSVGDISGGAKEWAEPVRLTTYQPATVAAVTALYANYSVRYGAPCCTLVDGALHLAWSNYLVTEYPGGESDESWTYWMASLDSGATWSEPMIVSHADSVIKGLACGSWNGDLVLAWSDSRDGNLEIYVKRFRAGGCN